MKGIMSPYTIYLVNGCHGMLHLIVAEHLEERLAQAGYHCRLIHQNVIDNANPPRSANLVLEFLPSFTEAEVGCPVINIKPLLGNPNHAPTLEKVVRRVQADYPAEAG